MHLERDVAHGVHGPADRTDVALELGPRGEAVRAARAKAAGQVAHGQDRRLVDELVARGGGEKNALLAFAVLLGHQASPPLSAAARAAARWAQKSVSEHCQAGSPVAGSTVWVR